MSEFSKTVYNFNSRIKLNDETTDPTEIILVDSQALLDTISNNVEDEMPTEPGIVDYGIKASKGVFEIPVLLYATTQAKMAELIQTLKSALNPDLLEADPTYGETTSYQGYHPFKWTETVGSTSRDFQIFLKSMETPVLEQDSLAGLIREAKLKLKARDPRKYLQGQITLAGAGTAVNAGTYPTPVIITIVATGATSTSLQIANTTRSEIIYVTTALSAGQTLVIDTLNHSVKLDGVERRDYISSASKWMKLSAGNNTITKTNDSNCTITTKFYSAWPL